MDPKVARPAGGAKAPRPRARAGSSENLSRVFQPGAVIAEDDGLRAASAIAPRQPDLPGAAVEIDMDLEVSHRGTIRPAA